MTISRDLSLAIFTMDSYNRGYGAALNDVGATDNDRLGLRGGIGDAHILDFDLPQGSEAAGFYAVASETQLGTVVSYRRKDTRIREIPCVEIPISFARSFQQEHLRYSTHSYKNVRQRGTQQDLSASCSFLTGHHLTMAL